MPKLRTKKEVLDRFETNPDFKAKAREVLDESWFQAWLDATLVNLGPFSIDAPFNPLPHVQDRQDGGKAAVNYFLHRLTYLPYTETSKDSMDGDQYVGFATASSIQTATNQIKKH
jgi:hypothetical protein